MDVIALDVSNGRSFCVLYQDNICQFEGEIKHNKKGFMRIQQLVDYYAPSGPPIRPIESFNIQLESTGTQIESSKIAMPISA